MVKKTLRSLIVYFSATGNTKKVADAIRDALEEVEVPVTFLEVKEAAQEELYNYNLVFLGSPSYEFLPAEPMLRFIREQMKLHRGRGDIKPGAPEIPGKTAVVFCTYSGPHTGINEAITAGKYMGQLFEHLGFKVAAEWYVIGEFHGREDLSTRGRLGDIRGRPNQQDLAKVKSDVQNLVKSIMASP